MKVLATTCIAATAFILSACNASSGSGSELDATNADTLAASISMLSQGMSEEERKSFGEDILTIYSSTSQSIENISAYPHDYNRAFTNPRMTQDIALEHPSLFDGKNPKQLSKIAFQMRRESILKRIELEQTDVTKRADFSEKMLACVNEVIAAGEARGETTAQAGQRSYDPMHMSNLVERRRICGRYSWVLSRADDELKTTLNAAESHDYSIPFDMAPLVKTKNHLASIYQNHAYCRPSANRSVEMNCSVTFPAN